MRLQLDLTAVDLGDAERFSLSEADALAQRMRVLLTDAGFSVDLSHDRADVDTTTSDWQLLTAAERSSGGFDYPELAVDGPANIVVDVFLQSVFISTQPDFDADQAATAQVVTTLRTLAPLLEIPDNDWHDIERAAAERAIAADGTILRPILSSSQLSDRAISLFDHAVSPEHSRPQHTDYASRLAELSDQVVADLPPFRAAIAADPSGSSFGLQLPWEPPFTDQTLKPLRRAMKTLLQDAIAHADDHAGRPTGIVVHHDPAGTTATLVFDNLVDSGALDPTQQGERHRSAPFAWEEITTQAARRDPAYQPTWLAEAVDLLAAGGTDITINGADRDSPDLSRPSGEAAPEATAQAEPRQPAPSRPPSRSLRDRLRGWLNN